jgi:hypothetical protein
MYIDEALRPLVDALRRRYPGVRIVEARYSRNHWGTLQQCVRYQAPLGLLRHVGLVTEDMLERRRGPRRHVTELGDGFHLCEQLDQASRPGYHELFIITGAAPYDDRDRISVREAARLLRQLAKMARRQ